MSSDVTDPISRDVSRRPSEPGSARDVAVVAVDGSSASLHALIWAFRHAVQHGLTVEVLTIWPLHGPVFVREVAGHFCEPRWRAREAQAEIVAAALAAVKDPPAHRLRIENSTVVDALARASQRSAVVVIGSDTQPHTVPRGRRLTERICDMAPGPVVIVGPDGPICIDARPDNGAVPVDADTAELRRWRDQAVALETELLVEFGDQIPRGHLLSVTARAIRASRREYGADLRALDNAERCARRALADLTSKLT